MAVYAEYIPRKRKPDLVSDEVPWRTMLLPGLILQKWQHGLQRSYAVRGPDLQGVSREEQGALMLQANEVLKRIGGRWMLQSEAQRTKVARLPKVAWPYIVPKLIDDERMATLLGTPGSRETTYYLTLSWMPPALTNKLVVPLNCCPVFTVLDVAFLGEDRAFRIQRRYFKLTQIAWAYTGINAPLESVTEPVKIPCPV